MLPTYQDAKNYVSTNANIAKQPFLSKITTPK